MFQVTARPPQPVAENDPAGGREVRGVGGRGEPEQGLAHLD